MSKRSVAITGAALVAFVGIVTFRHFHILQEPVIVSLEEKAAEPLPR